MPCMIESRGCLHPPHAVRSCLLQGWVLYMVASQRGWCCNASSAAHTQPLSCTVSCSSLVRVNSSLEPWALMRWRASQTCSSSSSNQHQAINNLLWHPVRVGHLPSPQSISLTALAKTFLVVPYMQQTHNACAAWPTDEKLSVEGSPLPQSPP